MPQRIFLATGCLLFCLCSWAAAQEKGAELLAGHSSHGEAFNEGPRQAAHLMGGTGNVHLPITSKSPDAQAYFDQGVGQLHGFWYFEAERSFRQVLLLDPDCPMAYWGLAMANVNNTGRAKPLIQKAVERKASASPREALWIDSLAAFYGDGDEKDRRRQFIRALENIGHEYPDELEAKAFLAYQIWSNSFSNLPLSSHQALDSLISEVLAVNPQHPVHHYRIHLWDGEKPIRALQSAASCGQAAPTCAHMWHMPGHILSKLERYADAVWQQEAATRVDHSHMIEDRILPDQIHNYAHNSEWMIRNLVFLGRVNDAVNASKNMIELPRHPRYNQLPGGGSAQYGRARLYDVLISYELWDELLALSDTVYLEPTTVYDEQIKRLRYIGVARFGRGDVEAGRTSIAELELMLVKEQSEQQTAAAEAENQARTAGKPQEEIDKAKTEALQGRNNRIQPLEAALAELRGLLAMAEGQFPAAIEQFGKSNRIGNEYLSRVHLAAGDLAKAEELARAALNGGNNQVIPLANLVEVLHRCGKAAEAAEQFTRLREWAAQADLAAPLFQRLKPIAQELGLPEDWRVTPPTPGDVGLRPEIAALGPFRWHPTPAPDWTLPGPDGSPVSLNQYRGRPVVLIFYQGFGCVHCVQQLQAFAPMQQQFADAGIEILAISSDSPEALANSLALGPQGTVLPFPLVSDAGLATFRAYRAFDDFENQPLHATVLVDGNGLVRWQDISYDPFTDAAFVLAEAGRQLGLTLAPSEVCAPAAAAE